MVGVDIPCSEVKKIILYLVKQRPDYVPHLLAVSIPAYAIIWFKRKKKINPSTVGRAPDGLHLLNLIGWFFLYLLVIAVSVALHPRPVLSLVLPVVFAMFLVAALHPPMTSERVELNRRLAKLWARYGKRLPSGLATPRKDIAAKLGSITNTGLLVLLITLAVALSLTFLLEAFVYDLPLLASPFFLLRASAIERFYYSAVALWAWLGTNVVIHLMAAALG